MPLTPLQLGSGSGGAPAPSGVSAGSVVTPPALVDLFTVLKPVKTPDGAGGRRVTWTAVQSDMPGRVNKVSSYKEIEQGDAAPRPVTTWLGLFSLAIDLQATYRVRKQGTFTVSLGNPSGGSYVLVLDGQATTTIPYDASPAAVQPVLEALPNVGPGNVLVTGSELGAITVQFINALVGTGLELQVDGSLLEGGRVTCLGPTWEVQATDRGLSQPVYVTAQLVRVGSE